MKYLRIFLILFLTNLVILVSPLASFTTSQGCDSDCVILNSSPIDFDLLYSQDNSTLLNEILNEIGNKTGNLPISPWGGFFTGAHIEGSDKWYFNSYRQLEIFSPHEAKFEVLSEREDSIFESVEENEVITDIDITINIGEDYRIVFGHITLLKSIYDEIKSTGKYSFTENEHIGYQADTGADFFAIDLWYLKGYESICPFFAFNPSIQTQVSNLYDLQYQRMILCGLYPQSNICSEISIYIDDTIWGPWEYKTGVFDEYLTEDSTGDVYPFTYQTYFNRNFTNAETYWKDHRIPYNNLTDDIIGIFGDLIASPDVPDYNKTGWSHVKLVEGNHSQGIMELCTFYISDWGASNTSIYAKFEIIVDPDGYLNDELKIEYFTTLNEAESGFTENYNTYIRYIPFGLRTTSAGFGYTSILVGLFATMIIVMIGNKKRKKHN
ncbi:MAG: hypothetical protein ACTSSH_01590 [Candidatus Heimdallarchaeota archaeon]